MLSISIIFPISWTGTFVMVRCNLSHVCTKTGGYSTTLGNKQTKNNRKSTVVLLVLRQVIINWESCCNRRLVCGKFLLGKVRENINKANNSSMKTYLAINFGVREFHIMMGKFKESVKFTELLCWLKNPWRRTATTCLRRNPQGIIRCLNTRHRSRLKRKKQEECRKCVSLFATKFWFRAVSVVHGK